MSQNLLAHANFVSLSAVLLKRFWLLLLAAAVLGAAALYIFQLSAAVRYQAIAVVTLTDWQTERLTRRDDPNDKNRIYYRSDHYNFAAKGVPIVFFFDGIHKDYHKPSDTPDKINYDLHEKRTRLVFFLAWDAANRNNMFVRDIPLNIPPR